MHARRIDISILNPAAMLTMVHRGTGAFTSPKEVATIAVLPHDDRLGFVVLRAYGFSLDDIRGWGGEISYDQPMPNHPSRIEKSRRRDHIPWDIGGVSQPPLPLERMVRESSVTPLDVPLHPRAAAVWQRHGFL
jgi:hypothetical protein